jgi:surface-anchored protein
MYTDGHADTGVAIEDGTEVFLHYHFHADAVLDGSELGDEAEYEPADVITVVPDPAAPRPAGAQWDFTGTSEGGNLWYISQVQEPGKPWLGLGTEEIDAGDITGDVTLTLSDFDGPGEFSLWDSDSFGEPIVKLSTDDNVTSFQIPAATHAHSNWGFTAAGVYELEFTATLTLSGGGPTISDTETFTFHVSEVPEPGSLSLLGVGATALLRRKRQRA